MKVLLATEKPFAKVASDGIREIVEKAGYELVVLEKYTDKSELLKAVADVDAIIIRSDKITAEVIEAPRTSKSSFVQVLDTTTWTLQPLRPARLS